MGLPTVIARRNLILALTLVGLVMLMAAVRTADWTSGAALHTTLEACATMLAVWVGTLSLVRYYSRKLSPYLFLGAGFLGTAALDAHISSPRPSGSRPACPRPRSR